MTRSMRCLAVIGVLTSSPAIAKSPIERVVVFADRAEVTRALTVPCTTSAGVSSATAVFAALPEGIDVRALRSEAEAPAVAVGVSVALEPLIESLDARVRALRDEMQQLDDQLMALSRQDQDARERTQERDSYASYFRALIAEELRQAKPDTSRWDAVLDTLASEAAAESARAVERAAQRRTIGRKRERIAARLARLQPAATPSSLDATVAVRCGAAGNATVRLSYIVPQATWHPEYDLRFTRVDGAKGRTGEGKAVLTVAGVVTQSTGEDWTSATVWLSTAKPALGGEAPLPAPIYVRGQPEEKQKTLVQAQEHRAAELKPGARASGGELQQAELDDGGKAFVLKLPKRVTVLADGRPYWFPVDDVSAPARSSLVAVPALVPWVYQLATLQNRAPYPLMAGTVHVFRAGTYIGDTTLEYRAPGEALEISLGIDEEVQLERKDLMLQQREAGLFSKDKSIVHAYRTIVRNRSDGEISVEIREQIPVSKTADVKVTLDEKKTAAGYKLDKVRGHLSWNAVVKKGGSAERDVAFVIKLPDAWAVQ